MPTPPRIVITVDGLAASGKSTLARLLAEHLNFIHLNTGLLYRSVSWLCLANKTDPHNEAAVSSLIAAHSLSLNCDDRQRCRAYIDTVDVTDKLHAPEVSSAVSIVAQQRAVRDALFSAQHDAFPGLPMVAEGRDMGTVVFRDAPLKFFVVANEDVRVERRVQQLMAASPELDIAALRAQTRAEVGERDRLDAARALAPMLAAPDSVRVDNSSNSLDKTLSSMLAEANSRRISPRTGEKIQ